MNDLSQKAKQIGIIPKRSSGQNFLIDENILNQIVECSDIKSSDKILEIGPGFGILTKHLLEKGAFVLAVEMDKKLASHMRETFSKYKNLHILEKDILKVSNKEIADILGKNFRVVSNIPYQITGKIVKKFLSSDLPKPCSACLLIQKEVAQRICAKQGSMSLLSLSVQLYSDPEICFNVPKEAFWPEPKVESSFLCMKNISEKPKTSPSPSLAGGEEFERRFWQIARIGFSSPRKQLKNNIANGLKCDPEVTKQAIINSGLKENIRAQELTIGDWVRLLGFL